MKQLCNPDDYQDLVAFIGVGAQKSGTSALFHYLGQHENLLVSNFNEAHFFDRDENFVAGVDQHQRYHQYFDKPASHQLMGEVTPVYMFNPLCAERIWQYNPNMRLIFILKNPVERVYSQWCMWQRFGGDVSFSDMLGVDSNTVVSNLIDKEDLARKKRNFIKRSLYAEQIKHYLKYFAIEQMFFLKTEQLRYQLEQSLNQLCDFLAIPAYNTMPTSKLIHSYKHTMPDMSAKDRAYLIDLFRPSIHELEDLLGWDCRDWLLD